MFIAYFVNAIMWKYGDQDTFENPIGFSEAMACVLSSRLLLNVRRVLKDAEADTSQVYPPSHGGPVHIRTDVETFTVRDDGDNNNLDYKAPVFLRHVGETDDSALERGAGGRPGVRLQVSACQSFEMGGMKAS